MAASIGRQPRGQVSTLRHAHAPATTLQSPSPYQCQPTQLALGGKVSRWHLWFLASCSRTWNTGGILQGTAENSRTVFLNAKAASIFRQWNTADCFSRNPDGYFVSISFVCGALLVGSAGVENRQQWIFIHGHHIYTCELYFMSNFRCRANQFSIQASCQQKPLRPTFI